MVGYLFTYFIFISTNDVKLDHPQDERLHLTITRTDERFDLYLENYYYY